MLSAVMCTTASGSTSQARRGVVDPRLWVWMGGNLLGPVGRHDQETTTQATDDSDPRVWM